MTKKTENEWKKRGKHLEKRFTFPDFTAAMGFMQQVSYHCEKKNHHPEWTNVYNRIDVKLSTHDAGKVTAKDHDLAKKYGP